MGGPEKVAKYANYYFYGVCESIFGCDGTEAAKVEIPDFLKDETTRSTLTWLGSGVAAVVGAIWGVYKFRSSKAKRNLKPSVSANNGSFSAGRDIRNNKIKMRSDGKR